MNKSIRAIICGVVLGCLGFVQAGFVAHYGFNETGGTVLNDSAGTATGTVTDVSFVAAGGSLGNAGVFNGTSSLVEFGDTSHPVSFELGTNDFTICGWFKAPQYLVDGVNPTLFRSMGSASPGGWAFQLGRNDRTYRGEVFFTIGGSDSISIFSDARLDDDEWHFVSVVRSNDTVSMYVDNVLQADVKTALAGTLGTAPATSEAFMGGYGAGEYYPGQLNEWSIYNEALDSAALAGLWAVGQSSDPVVVAQYDFDETGGSVLNDSMGSADGTATAVSFVTSGVGPGTFGNAGSFDGTSSVVSFGNNTHPTSFDLGTNNFTLGGWFKAPENVQAGVNQPIFRSMASASNGGWAFDLGRADRSYAGKVFFQLGGSDAKTLFSNRRLDDDQWHFILVVRSGNMISMYVDSILQTDVQTGSAGTTGTAPVTTEAFAGQYGSLSYTGQLDAWSIRDGALDGAALDSLWIAGLADPERVAHYAFDETGGSVLNDSVGSANGTATDVSFEGSGRGTGNAGSFNGTSSTVQFGSGSHPASFDLGTSDFTICGWFKTPLNAVDSNLTVFRAGTDPDAAGWSLQIGRSARSYAGEIIFTLGGSDFGTSQVFSDGRADDDQWHFVTVVNSSGNISMYVDNVLQSDTGSSLGAVSGSAAASEEAFFGQQLYTGLLDEWSLYTGALGTNEITILWTDGQAPGLIEIISMTSVSNETVELVVSTDSPSRCWPKSIDALVGGSWSNVAHSSDGVAPFVVTNLDYSSSTVESNFSIYVEMNSDQKFFKIDAE